ncbi:MAG TPA: hypothetical protein VNZ52_14635 [Candidatus Thermoplasmatota archaeon]|nr:hypothetical protein [Candidatus Thermoplasmatota archaeon]
MDYDFTPGGACTTPPLAHAIGTAKIQPTGTHLVFVWPCGCTLAAKKGLKPMAMGGR